MSVDLSSVTESYFLDLDEDEHETTPRPLWGRNHEKSQLLEIYSQVVATKRAAVVAVHGESGTGKTSLVEILRKTAYDSLGYYVAGKFFQNSTAQEPYSAIMAAFSDLCDVVQQSEDFGERRIGIQTALGTDGRFLEKSISGLSPFLFASSSERNAMQDPRNDGAMLRFKVACKTFLHAMSSPKHPIVLFIDDVQWADEGSRQLLNLFLRDSELKNVVLILAYREEEAEKVTGMFLLQDTETPVIDIFLQNLDLEGIFQIVSVAISSTSKATRQLSELIANKTRGNPFHVIQFIETIEREGLLHFESDEKGWQFDVNLIRKQVMVSNTLAGLLERKIKTLHSDIQETLKIASLLGFRFEEEILVEIASAVIAQKREMTWTGDVESKSSITLCLTKAAENGFIEKIGGGYQFSHDKLQHAFQSMLQADEEERLQKLIGEAFLLVGKDDESVYYAAVHLNRATGLLQNKDERVTLARINLRASLISKQKCAFDSAATLLQCGLDLIDDSDKWLTYFDLTFELTESLAKMELVNGNFERCKNLTKEALLHGTSVEMKIEALMISVEVLMASNATDEMVITATEALTVFGVDMPRKVSTRHVLGKLLRVRRMIRRLSYEQIVGLPSMDNRIMSYAVTMLANVSNYCLLKDEKPMAIFSGLIAVELSLAHGVSPFSANALVVHGLTELSLGNHDRAYKLGKVAMDLLRRFNRKDAVCAASSVKFAALTHWKEPLRMDRDPFLNAFNAGFDTGDMVYAIYSLAQCFGYRLHLGEKLASLEHFMRDLYRRLCDMSKDGMIRWLRPSLQFVLIMQSQCADCRDTIALTGEVMNEREHMNYAISNNHRVLIVIGYVYKAMLAFYFGHFSIAEGLYNEIGGIGSVFKLNFSAMPMYLYAGVTQFARYQETGKRAHLKSARKYKKELQRSKSIGSPNVDSYLALLDAEEVLIKNSQNAATLSAAYQRAIEVTAAEGLIHLEGLANERAAFALVKLECLSQAEPYFSRALELYRYEWGATVKYERLQEQSKACLAGLQQRPSPAQDVQRIVVDGPGH